MGVCKALVVSVGCLHSLLVCGCMQTLGVMVLAITLGSDRWRQGESGVGGSVG